MPRLFSYGTLQFPQVQLDQFGRLLDGAPDALRGFRTVLIEITDPAVIASSGTNEHPLVIASEDPTDSVSGTVFDLTDEELRAADAYEVDDYARARVTLASGTDAWVYLASS